MKNVWSLTNLFIVSIMGLLILFISGCAALDYAWKGTSGKMKDRYGSDRIKNVREYTGMRSVSSCSECMHYEVCKEEWHKGQKKIMCYSEKR